jgi:aquaporin Z
MGRKLAAEFFGTFILVFVAVGSAVFGFNLLGPVGVALAFGFTLAALAYAIGPTSGCHVNPAVTFGMLLTRRISPFTAVAYWVAQFIGAILAAGLLKFIVSQHVVDQTGALGSNTFANPAAGKPITTWGAFVAEAMFTGIFVLVILLVTAPKVAIPLAGFTIGLALGVAHLADIPLTGAGLNPARSFGPALWAPTSSHAMGHVWLFLLAPMVGAVLAAIVFPIIRPADQGAVAATA